MARHLDINIRSKHRSYVPRPLILEEKVKPIKFLIYTVAIGKIYGELAHMLKVSCAKKGYNLFILNEKHGKDPFKLRMQIADFINIEEFDWIIYIDADCLVFGDITKLLMSKIVVQKDSLSYLSNLDKIKRWKNNYNIIYQHDLDKPGINSGGFVLPRKFYYLLIEWQRLYNKTGGTLVDCYSDQVTLNFLLYKDFINQFIVTDSISYLLRPGTIIAHYYGRKYKIMHSDFIRYIN